MKVTKKANLSTREKQALTMVGNSTNELTIQAISELDELQKYTSHLLDTMFFRAIRKGSVSDSDLRAITKEFERQVKATMQAVDSATSNKERVISIVKEQVQVR